MAALLRLLARADRAATTPPRRDLGCAGGVLGGFGVGARSHHLPGGPGPRGVARGRGSVGPEDRVGVWACRGRARLDSGLPRWGDRATSRKRMSIGGLDNA